MPGHGGGGTGVTREADWHFKEFGLQIQNVREAPADVTWNEPSPARPRAVTWFDKKVIPEN